MGHSPASCGSLLCKHAHMKQILKRHTQQCANKWELWYKSIKTAYTTLLQCIMAQLIFWTFLPLMVNDFWWWIQLVTNCKKLKKKDSVTAAAHGKEQCVCVWDDDSSTWSVKLVQLMTTWGRMLAEPVLSLLTSLYGSHRFLFLSYSV